MDEQRFQILNLGDPAVVQGSQGVCAGSAGRAGFNYLGDLTWHM